MSMSIELFENIIENKAIKYPLGTGKSFSGTPCTT